MNTQNILGYYGTKLDLKLDHSEFYDYELAKNEGDYNTEIFKTTPITYGSLKISDSLSNSSCDRTTITLNEYDNRINDSSYPYSGLTVTLDYDNFTDYIGDFYKYTILNNDVYVFSGITNETHYFTIGSYNGQIDINTLMGENEEEILLGFSKNYLKCTSKLSGSRNCCPITPKLDNKPWAYQFLQQDSDCDEPIIRRRTEKGWTLDFIFNRESQPWSNGSVFYYFGTRGSNDPYEYADSNLSFKFTSDGRIQWTAIRYSNECTVNGTSEDFTIETGTTPRLCTTGDTKDFNITIVFDRYNRLEDCDIENDGGWNDMLGTRISPYSDNTVTAVTSTQITTVETQYEELNKKWYNERNYRLGTLKIYLNGRPIYKIGGWEEVVPSNRGVQPFIQSWGGGPNLIPQHSGTCCFNMKSIKYYEEPLDFIHVRHNFLTRQGQYDFFVCGGNCEDDLIGFVTDGLLTEDGVIIISETNDIVTY